MLALPDTDMLSLLQRKTPAVVRRAESYLAHYGRFSLTELTRYEIERGYRAVEAHKQLANFREFCADHQVLPLTWPALERASQIWADLRRAGRLIGEVDILTAAIALESRMALATRNTEHFQRIEGLVVENWASESQDPTSP